MTFGVVCDFMTPPALPAQLWALGVQGVAVYVDPLRWGWPKDVHIEYIQAGLAIPSFGFAFIAEKGIKNWQGGKAQGRIDGADWLQGVNDRAASIPQLVAPGNLCPALPTYDTSIPPSEFATAMLYQEGFIEACAPHPVLSVYAEGALIEAMFGAGLAVMGWESESKSFPGNLTPTAHTTMVQIVDHAVPGLSGSYDYNAVLAADWSQWPRPSIAPQPEAEDVIIYPRLAPDAHYAGRHVGLAFSPSNQTLLLTNGGRFKSNGTGDAGFDKTWRVTQWPVPNPTGVTSTAQFIAAHSGALDFGIREDGGAATLTAAGDGGTFDAPFQNVLPDPSSGGGAAGPQGPPGPPGASVDIGTLAIEVAKHLKVATA